jgi:hypothetical protein
VIRRDYLLRMIEDFLQALARIKSLQQGERWQEAAGTLDQQFQKLVGLDAPAIMRLSESELLARLVGEATHLVRERTFILITLLNEAGDLAAKQDQMQESASYCLKALDLLLSLVSQAEVLEFPEFVPKVEGLVAGLQDTLLPIRTRALLMQHYERLGEFGRAEDMLFRLIEDRPQPPGILEFGLAFYERLEELADTALSAGNLPRPELEAGLRELRARTSTAPAGGAAR